MNRNIQKIVRDLEDKKNNDIIWKKDQLMKMFHEDPDILELLGKREKRPYTANMTDEQKKEVDIYNAAINHEQIVPWLKLNGIQKEVLNFLMFDINDQDVSYTNNVIKNQYLVVMCLVHEDDMDTEYEVTRVDLLDYVVRDLLCWSNCLGAQLKLVNDFTDIVDTKYYARTLKFKIETINGVRNGAINPHDRR